MKKFRIYQAGTAFVAIASVAVASGAGFKFGAVPVGPILRIIAAPLGFKF